MNASITDPIGRAVRRRAEVLGDDTNACRVFDGAGDGIEGVFIDDFAGHWLVQTRGRELPPGLVEACGGGSCRSLWWKALEQEEKGAPQWMWGERLDAPFAIRENGCAFRIDFQAGYSQGLFLDQRLNREEVLRRAGENPGAEILNCFAYTCGFSVAAATGGARTVSVDLSTRYLDWGKSNFELNALDFNDHEFCRGDVAEWLKRFARKGRLFDGVILDPPTFSRNQKGKIFRAEKDFGSLAALASKVVARNGWLLCCSNNRSLHPEKMAAVVRSGIRESGRRIVGMQSQEMPPEYRDEKYLKAFWFGLA